MTDPGDDLSKKKADEAARMLAESLLGLSMGPPDLGGEVLFDDYDDAKSPVTPAEFAGSESPVLASAADDGATASQKIPAAGSLSDSFDDELDDLIVFGDEEDDEDEVVSVVSETDDDD